MATVELHADYDRNGRLQAAAPEYALRSTAPGAVVVPNLDVDRRALPASVQAAGPVVLDRDQPVALAGDDELAPLRVRVSGPVAAGQRFFLRPVGFARIRLRINDAQGRILPQDLSRPGDLPIVLPPSGDLDFTLSVNTLPGSPWGHVTDLNARFRLDLTDESAFEIHLVSVDAAGAETIADRARFSVAPFVVLDNAAAAIRAYICDLPENQASVIEFEAACRALGLPLVKVPATVANGDAWLQDQFQHALMQGADGWRQVLIHLPRLRANSGHAPTANLAAFVTSHFPSRNLGVFEDLWRRELQIVDAQGRVRRIAFRDCDKLAVAMHQVISLIRLFIDKGKRLDRTYDPQWPETWSECRAWLPVLFQQLRQRVQRARAGASTEWAGTLDRTLEDARARLTQLAARLPHNPDRGLFGLPAGQSQIEVDAETAQKIFLRAGQMHHSSNYGGNIEASPPTADAQLGKLVIGNRVVGEADFMDPDVLQLLHKQKKQPIVQIDTTWLDVGHVDEIMTFAPDRRTGQGAFAVLRASPELAMRLVAGARDRYLAGLPEAHTHRATGRVSGVLPRLTVDGASPVTRLLRGKVWSHAHRRPEGDQAVDILEPPRIYQDVAQAMNGGDPDDPDSGFSAYDIRYWPGEGPDRTYPADISVRELIYGDQDLNGVSTNGYIEAARMAPVREALAAAFPSARQFPLPVVFDRVASTMQWALAPDAFSTSAFTPDVINMQVLGGRLLIPRPYGPRMKPADATAVIAAAAQAMGLPDGLARRLNARFYQDKGLLRGVYWLHRQDPVYRTISTSGLIRQLYPGLETEGQVVEQFRDSFPGASADQLRERIIRPNRRHFDANGRLRDGWRRFDIAETLVDLFEAWILMVAAELDAPVTFVDSWYYHVHAGGVHCGTNVLRQPHRGASLPRVWTVPDVTPVETIDFEEEVVGAD